MSTKKSDLWIEPESLFFFNHFNKVLYSSFFPNVACWLFTRRVSKVQCRQWSRQILNNTSFPSRWIATMTCPEINQQQAADEVWCSHAHREFFPRLSVYGTRTSLCRSEYMNTQNINFCDPAGITMGSNRFLSSCKQLTPKYVGKCPDFHCPRRNKSTFWLWKTQTAASLTWICWIFSCYCKPTRGLVLQNLPTKNVSRLK